MINLHSGHKYGDACMCVLAMVLHVVDVGNSAVVNTELNFHD